MKIDLARLPVAEMVIVFLVAVLAVTFIAAFGAVSGGGGGKAVSESPAATASPGGSPTPGGGTIAVSIGDYFFDPNGITVAAGQTVTFEVTNKGTAIHNMHVGGADGEYKDDFCKKGGADPCSGPNTVSGGASATLVWDVPNSPGQFPFRCDFHPDQMKGTITVK
jgi:plastocyanin